MAARHPRKTTGRRPCSARRHFQVGEPAQGLLAGVAAHLGRGLQRAADGGAFGLTEEAAAQLGIQMWARHARRLAVGRPGRGS